MATKRRNNNPANQSLQRHSGGPPDSQGTPEGQPIDPEVLLPVPTARPLINAQIIQILIEKDNPDEIEKLMRLELDYNKERFEIMRDHSKHHPEAIESRKTRQFRRVQYIALIAVMFALIVAMPFVAFPVAATFGLVCVLIVAALSLNGREREVDLGGFVKVLTTIVKRDSRD